MRAFVAAALLLLAGQACAQDVLRGTNIVPLNPSTRLNWGGFYAGAQIGYVSSLMDFTNGTQDQVAYSLRNSALGSSDVPTWQVLGEETTRATSFGGFAGFNSQWEDVVLGLEVNYNRTSLSGSSSGSLSRGVTADGLLYNTTVTGSGSMRITDYGTVRARAGYLYGNMMGYVFGGFALGRANVNVTTSVFGVIDPNGTPTPFGPFTQTESKTSYPYGWSVGGGLEMAFLPMFFVRAEYEYVKFSQFVNLNATLNTVRVGGGVKF